MFNHVMVGSTDVERSKRFYDAVLGVLGAGAPARNEAATGHVRYFYRHDGSTFGITQPINNEPACGANGGTSIEDPPGPRGTLHLAYVRAPDGNKLCAIYRA